MIRQPPPSSRPHRRDGRAARQARSVTSCRGPRSHADESAPRSCHLGPAFEGPRRSERNEITYRDAAQPGPGGQDDPNFRVVVQEDLAVAATRPDRAPPVVTHRNDVCDRGSTACPGRTEGDEFRAGAAGEVSEIHACECPAVSASDRCAHGVNAVLAGTGVRGGINGRSGKFDEFLLVPGQWTSGGRQRGSHRPTVSPGEVSASAAFRAVMPMSVRSQLGLLA